MQVATAQPQVQVPVGSIGTGMRAALELTSEIIKTMQCFVTVSELSTAQEVPASLFGDVNTLIADLQQILNLAIQARDHLDRSIN